jgi:hypothetical protein
MDAEGNVIAKQGDRTVAGFQKTLDALATVAKLEAKEKAGDASVAADLLLARLQTGSVDITAAKQKRATLDKTDAAKLKVIDQMLTNVEFATISRAPMQSKEDSEARSRTFAEMYKAGRIPDGQMTINFCNAVAAYAAGQKDVALLEQVLGTMRQAAGDKSPYKTLVERHEKALEKLKAEAGGK